MRAIVYRGVNDLRLETVPVPRIGAHELLVKVAVCGVCPTDIKKIQYGTVPPPRIFGHETAGTIVKIGGLSSNFKLRTSNFGLRLGDRVALHHHVPCLDCHFCRHRAFAQCATYKRTGITAGFEPAGGGYAEYVRVMPFVLPGVVKIPAKNSFAEGAMLEPVNTVLKAVRRLNLLRGDAVLVAGQGPIGLMFTRLLQLAGARVLATDLLASRLRLARKFGAKWTHWSTVNQPTQVRRPTTNTSTLDSRPALPLLPFPPMPPFTRRSSSSAAAARSSSLHTRNELKSTVRSPQSEVRSLKTIFPSALSLQPSALIWRPFAWTRRSDRQLFLGFHVAGRGGAPGLFPPPRRPPINHPPFSVGADRCCRRLGCTTQA